MTLARDNPGVIAPPPLVFAGFLALGFVLDVATGHLGIRFPVWLGWIAAGLLAAGSVALLTQALARLKSAGTRPEPWRPTTAIVTDGIYRYSRNPIYLAMALAYLAIVLAFDSIFGLLLLGPAIAVMQVGVIAREERYLETKFGAEYRRYKDTVRRWI